MLHVISGETTNTIFRVFGLIRSGLEPTIYRTRGEHDNHYTIDAILEKCKDTKWVIRSRNSKKDTQYNGQKGQRMI
jgi:hypothetical protein